MAIITSKTVTIQDLLDGFSLPFNSSQINFKVKNRVLTVTGTQQIPTSTANTRYVVNNAQNKQTTHQSLTNSGTLTIQGQSTPRSPDTFASINTTLNINVDNSSGTQTIITATRSGTAINTIVEMTIFE